MSTKEMFLSYGVFCFKYRSGSCDSTENILEPTAITTFKSKIITSISSGGKNSAIIHYKDYDEKELILSQIILKNIG